MEAINVQNADNFSIRNYLNTRARNEKRLSFNLALSRLKVTCKNWRQHKWDDEIK